MQCSPRLATPSDVSAVADLVRRAYSPYVSRIGREPGPMGDDYAALIGEGRVQVIDRDGRIEAVLVLLPQADAMLLDNVAVAPEAQGLGFGRIMLQYAEQSARAAGYRQIRLYTNQAMTENIALYGRLGYAETHRVEEKGLRRVYMVKELALG